MNEFVEKHKIYLIAAAVALLLAVGYWYFIFEVQKGKIKTLTNEIANLDKQIVTLTSNLAKLEKLAAEYPKLVAQQKALRKEVA